MSAILGATAGALAGKNAPPENFVATSGDEEMVLTWTAGPTVSVLSKVTGTADTSFSEIYSGTLGTYTETGLTKGTLRDYRIINETAGKLPSDPVDINDVRVTNFDAIYNDSVLSVNACRFFVHPQRKDLVKANTAGTTAITNGTAVEYVENLSDGTNPFDSPDGAATERFTWNETEGMLESPGGTTGDGLEGIGPQTHVTSSDGITQATLIFGAKYDATTTGMWFATADSNFSPLFRITNTTTVRCKTDSGNTFDFTPSAISSGYHVFALTLDVATTGDEGCRFYIDGTEVGSAIAPQAASTVTLRNIGNTATNQRAIADGLQIFKWYDGILTPAQVATESSIVLTAIQTGSEDWNASPTVSDPELAHLKDSLSEVMSPPTDLATPVYDFSSLPFPREAKTEARYMRTGNDNMELYDVISSQKISFNNLKTNQDDYGCSAIPYISTRASQAEVLDPTEAGLGMAFNALGLSTVGTTATPELYVKHILYGPAVQLTSFLSGANSTTTSVAQGDVSDVVSFNYAIVYEGAKHSFTNPEYVFIASKTSQTGELVIQTSGGYTGRGFKSTTTRTHNSGSWIQSVVLGGSSTNKTNFGYNLTNYREITLETSIVSNGPFVAGEPFTTDEGTSGFIQAVTSGPDGLILDCFGGPRPTDAATITSGSTSSGIVGSSVSVTGGFEDGNGNTGAEALSDFILNNYNKNQNDTTIAYTAFGHLDDVDFDHIPNGRNADALLLGSKNNGYHPDYDQYNVWEISHEYKRSLIRDGQPNWHIVRGMEYCSRYTHSTGVQFENMGKGGQRTETISATGIDGWMSLFDSWRFCSSDGPPFVNYVNRHGADSAISPTIARTALFYYGLVLQMEGFYTQEDQDIATPVGEFNQTPFPPAAFVNSGQVGAAGSFGDCVYPWVGSWTTANAITCKGWLGAPVSERQRHYDRDEFAIANSTEHLFTSGITGWTAGGSVQPNISHNAGDNALQFNSWDANGPAYQFGTSLIYGPTYSITAGQAYSVVMRVRATGSRHRHIMFGLVGQDIQHAVVSTAGWHYVINTFVATQTGTPAIVIRCGLHNDPFQVESVRIWPGALGTFIKEFDNGYVVTNLPTSPAKTVPLPITLQRPLLTGANASTYDPDNILNGATESNCFVQPGQSIYYLKPE